MAGTQKVLGQPSFPNLGNATKHLRIDCANEPSGHLRAKEAHRGAGRLIVAVCTYSTHSYQAATGLMSSGSASSPDSRGWISRFSRFGSERVAPVTDADIYVWN